MAPPALPFTRDVPPRARTRPVDPPRRPGHRRGVSHETPGDASRHRGATRGRPRDVEPRDPRAKHALVGHELRVQRERWREIRAVVGRVRADVRGVLERGVLPMERTQMGRGEGPDGAVEVPNAGVQVVRGERAHGVGRRVHGHGVHAGVGEAHGEEAKGGKKSTASSGNGATTRGLTQLTRVGSESNRSMLY